MGRFMVNGSEAWNLLAKKLGGAMPMYDKVAQTLEISTTSARNLVKGDARINQAQTGDLLALFSRTLGGSWKMTGLGPVREEQKVIDMDGPK